MRRRFLAGFFLAFLLWAPLARCAADPAGSLVLRDGRVLHHVRTVSDEGTAIVVSADEGMFKIGKSDLPGAADSASPANPVAPAKAAPELVMQSFNPDLAPAEPAQEPGSKKPASKPATPGLAKGRAEPDPVYNGCLIVSFRAKPFQTAMGCAEVVVRNGTDAPVVLRPGDFTCVTVTGARHAGRSIVFDGFPPTIRRRAVVPPQGEIDDIVTFTSESLDISSVQWSR